MTSELEKAARRNLIIQAIFLVFALGFFTFTVLYAVNFVVHSETNRQTAQMNAERDKRLATRDAILREQFSATKALIDENQQTLLELQATIRYSEAQRVGRERREMRRFAELHAAVERAQTVMDRHDAQIMKGH